MRTGTDTQLVSDMIVTKLQQTGQTDAYVMAAASSSDTSTVSDVAR